MSDGINLGAILSAGELPHWSIDLRDMQPQMVVGEAGPSRRSAMTERILRELWRELEPPSLFFEEITKASFSGKVSINAEFEI